MKSANPYLREPNEERAVSGCGIVVGGHEGYIGIYERVYETAADSRACGA